MAMDRRVLVNFTISLNQAERIYPPSKVSGDKTVRQMKNDLKRRFEKRGYKETGKNCLLARFYCGERSLRDEDVVADCVDSCGQAFIAIRISRGTGIRTQVHRVRAQVSSADPLEVNSRCSTAAPSEANATDYESDADEWERMPSASMVRTSTGRTTGSRWADISPSVDASEYIDTSILFPPTPDNFGPPQMLPGASSSAAAVPGLTQFAPAPAALTAAGAGLNGTAPVGQVTQMAQMAPAAQMQGIQMMQLPNGQMVQVIQVPAGQMPGGLMPMGPVMMPGGQGPAPGVQMAPMMMLVQPPMTGVPQGVPLPLAPQPMAPQQPSQQPVAGPASISAPPTSPPLGQFSPTSPTSPPPAGNADGDEPYRHEVEQHPEAILPWSAGRQLFTEAIDSKTVDDLAHDGQPLASQGSALHGTGRCSPCAWFWKARGCQNGSECDYCHLCPEGELKNRKKQKVAQIRQTVQDAAGEAPVAAQRSLALSNLL